MPPAVPVIQQSTDQDSSDRDTPQFNERQPHQLNVDIEQEGTRGLPSRSPLQCAACWMRRVLVFILLRIIAIYFFLLILRY